MKLFLTSIVFFIAITALAPFASAQTLYWVGGTTATGTQPAQSVGVIMPATDMNFNTAANWSTTPPNQLTNQPTGPQTVPGPGNIAVVDADLNNGTITDGFIFIGTNVVPQPVVINQTTQGNTVQGFVVSNYFYVGGGVVNYNNASNGTFTINGTNVSSGDFLVDGGVTFNYNGNLAPALAVTQGKVVIGDNNTGAFGNGFSGGTGTFNINSGGYTFDAPTGTTSMYVGYSTTGSTGTGGFGNATGTVVQGAAATGGAPATASFATLGSTLVIGYNGGTGTWKVTNGSVLSTGTLASSYTIALGSNGGVGTLDGTGGSGVLVIGTPGSTGVPATAGTFNLGTVGSATPVDLQLGTVDPASTLTTGGSGILTENAGTVNMQGQATTVEVGDTGGGTGTVNLLGGTMNIGVNATDAVTFTLGATTGSIGTLTQTGGILNVGPSTGTNGTVFTVGQTGTGVYNMNGGVANFNTAINLGATGSLNLNGGVINISAANFTPLAPGQGTLNFGNINIPGATGGTINFTSGTTFNDTYAGGIIATNATATFNASVGTFTTVMIGQNLSGGGGLTLIGTDGNNGTASTQFTFTGANTYSGPTTIAGGTLTTSAANIASSSSLNILSNTNPVAFGGTSVGTLNLNLAANGLAYAGAVTGNGNLNIKYNTAGDTFAVQNAGNFSGNVILGATNGAASGPAGNFQVYSGTYGNISEGTANEAVTIGGALPAGINNAFVVPPSGAVTIGTATYTGLTTISSGFTLNVTGAGGLLGGVNNAGTLSTASIGGDVTNTAGMITVTGATGIIGNVSLNTGTISAMTIGGNLDNAIGGTFINTGAVNTTTVGGNVTNGGLLMSTAGLPAPGNSTFTIGGSLTQSATGTLVVRVSGTAGNPNHDFYQTGAGDVLDGTINVTGGTTSGDSTFTYITPGGTFDPTLTLTSSALLNAQFTGGVPGDSITITQVPISTYALTPNQTAVANALDSTDNPLKANYFNNIPTVAAAQAEIPQALDQLSPEALQYSRNIAFENSTFLAQRMNGVDENLRSGYGGLDTSAISLANPGFESGLGRSMHSMLASDGPFHSTAPNGVNYYPSGSIGGPASESSSSSSGSSSTESATEPAWSPSSQVISDSPNPYLANQNPSGPDAPKMNEFIGGDAILADLNQDQSASNAAPTKARYTAEDITAGVGFRMASHLTAGVLFDYNHTDAKTDTFGSRTRVDSYSPGLFATYFEKGFYVNGLFSFGYNNYSNARAIPILGPSTTANSNPDGQQYVADLDTGYDFHPNKAWVVGPTVGVTYTHLDVDSFTEQGAPGADLAVDSQSVDSVRSRLGGHAIFQTNTGDVLLQPNITAMWQHEYLANSSGITSSFSDFGSNAFTIQTAAPGRDSALIGLGLTATLNTSVALYLNYLADVGASDYFAQTVYGGLKARF